MALLRITISITIHYNILMSNIKTHFQNRLPHIAPVGAIFFVTFRLEDSIPQSILRDLKAQYTTAINSLMKEKPPGYKE
jgi:hypothetical protein